LYFQAWADAFRNQPDLQGVVQVYEELVSKGVTFPATDLDAMAPILTPKQSYEVVSQPDGPITASAEQLAKLRSDLDVVNSNLKVFREMLTEIVPGRETQEELQLLKELHSTCKQMQLRVLDLIRTVGNEEVTCEFQCYSTFIGIDLLRKCNSGLRFNIADELLVMNDEFNSVFEKYDRFMTNRSGDATGDASAPSAQPATADLIDVGQAKSLEEQLAGMKVTSASTADAYAANSEQQAPVGIATAINNKNSVTDVEAQEMENWLAAQGQKGKQTLMALY
ncbi:GAT domain protein, partial [Ancylostoma duodenale]